MKPLFEKRVGAWVAEQPVTITLGGINLSNVFGASWPLSKIEFFKDHLIINVRVKKFRLDYDEIDYIDKKFTVIRIHHHAKNMDKYVYIQAAVRTGRLLEEVKEAIKKNGLKIKVKV